jgi:hypothetical protein
MTVGLERGIALPARPAGVVALAPEPVHCSRPAPVVCTGQAVVLSVGRHQNGGPETREPTGREAPTS